jgi:hypothetical protein
VCSPLCCSENQIPQPYQTECNGIEIYRCQQLEISVIYCSNKSDNNIIHWSTLISIFQLVHCRSIIPYIYLHFSNILFAFVFMLSSRFASRNHNVSCTYASFPSQSGLPLSLAHYLFSTVLSLGTCFRQKRMRSTVCLNGIAS